ncbi:MAG: hypothetical protein ACRCWD_00865 [Culicoidibacterales bacterium]
MTLHKNDCHKTKKHGKKNHKNCGCNKKSHKKHDVTDQKHMIVLAVVLAVVLTGGLAVIGYFAWKNLQVFMDELE